MDVKRLVIKPTIEKSKKFEDMGVDAYYDGYKCYVKSVDGELARRTNALNLIEHDLKQCLKYLEEIGNQKELIKIAIFKAFIITYGKCFSSGEKRGISLKSQAVFKDSDSKLVDLHKLVIKLRNQYVAHSDHDVWDCGEVSLIYPPEHIKNEKPIVLRVSQKYSGLPCKPSALINLANFVLDYAKNASRKCNATIINSA